MGLLNIISHMALREHFPIREIARRAGLLRNTIKSCPNSGTVEPKFETDGIPCPDLAHGGPRALSGPSWSVALHGRQADHDIIADRPGRFQRHVAAALDGPFFGLLHQDRADRSPD